MNIQEDVKAIRKIYKDYLISIRYYTGRNRTLDEFIEEEK